MRALDKQPGNGIKSTATIDAVDAMDIIIFIRFDRSLPLSPFVAFWCSCSQQSKA